MDINETMTNTEAIETADEITNAAGKGAKIAAGVGIAMLVSVITYRRVVKPMLAKIKARKLSQSIGFATDDVDIEEAMDIPEDSEN